MNLGKSIIYLSVLATTTLLTGCGDDKKPQANTVVEPVVQDGPQVDTPTTDDTPVPATNIKDIDFVDTKVDLEGDFRIKEVLRDHGGNYYVAIVSSANSSTGTRLRCHEIRQCRQGTLAIPDHRKCQCNTKLFQQDRLIPRR